MRFYKIFFASLILFFGSALDGRCGVLLPWNPVMKAYIGVDYTNYKIQNHEIKHNTSIQDFGRFRNYNLFAGVRIFKYFGVETGFLHSGQDIKNQSISGDAYKYFSMNQKYIDGKLYFPLINNMLFSMDLFTSYGVTDFNASTVDLSNNNQAIATEHRSGRYGGGLEMSLFGAVSARAGVNVLENKLAILDNQRLTNYYLGFSLYLL